MGEQELPPGHPVEGQPQQPRSQHDAQVEREGPPPDDLEAENAELVLEALVHLGVGQEIIRELRVRKSHSYNFLQTDCRADIPDHATRQRTEKLSKNISILLAVYCS